MRVSGNLCQSTNKFINAASINRCLAGNKETQANGGKKDKGKDLFTLSPQGKIMNMINSLAKQKEYISAKKNELMAKALEEGNCREMKAQLQMYTEQIKAIDQQISDIYAQQAKESTEKAKEAAENKNETSKTHEEEKIEELSQIASAKDKIKDSENVLNIKNGKYRQGKIKECESKQEKLRADNLESKKILSSNPKAVEMLLDTARLIIRDKAEEADMIFKQADKINLKAGKLLEQAKKILQEKEQDKKANKINEADMKSHENENL